MNRIILTFAFVLLNQLLIFSQRHTISGFVYDKENKEVLIGATVYDSVSLKGTITNSYGFYSLSLENKEPVLIVSFMGYMNQQKPLVLSRDLHVNFEISSDISTINEIDIKGQSKYNPLNSNEFNVSSLNPKTIEALPIAFGENDVIKAIQLESGVTSLGEGSSGIYVQGGNTDQNLIIIDEAPIYNPAHLFGLVSVFNPDAIKNVEFYKGAIPVEFGGKLSSVIDCQMNDGNKKNVRYSGGLGTLTAHAAIEGPVKHDTASYLFAVRRSIRDLFENPGKYVTYVPQFYDINAKLNWNVNNKNRLFLSLYAGKDEIKTSGDFNNRWSNITTTFRWNRVISNKLFSNISVIYSKYNNDLEFIAKTKNYKWLTGVEDIISKMSFSWYLSPDNKIKFGIETIYHKYIPGENETPEESLFRINALESSAYILNDIDISSWLGVNYGLRYSLFQNIGKGKWYTYDAYNPIELNENHKGIYNTYHFPEPRITINIKPKVNQVLKLGYSRTVQYSQVLQNSVFSYTSLQSWLPANPNVDPLSSNIFSGGWFAIYGNINLSAEVFYKELNNIVDYVEHAQLVNNPYIETQIETGNGISKGISFQVDRKTENLELEASYAFSRIKYHIDGINNNLEYPALHDIPNDVRLKTLFKPTKRIGISAFWTYHTGFVITLPVGSTYGVPIYTSRNEARLPDYHRLDISLYLYPKPSEKRWKGTWSAGVYNAYGRFNPIGVNISESSISGTVYLFTLYRMIPFISYNFKF